MQHGDSTAKVQLGGPAGADHPRGTQSPVNAAESCWGDGVGGDGVGGDDVGGDGVGGDDVAGGGGEGGRGIVCLVEDGW